MQERTDGSIRQSYQLKVRVLFVLIMVLLLLGITPALADFVLEPMGPFWFSTGIDGSFDFSTQSVENRSYGEAYISCSCGAEKHNIQTQYRIEAAEGCPIDITLEITGRKKIKPEAT